MKKKENSKKSINDKDQFIIHRNEEWYKHHMFYAPHAVEYGLDTACVLGNLHKFPNTDPEEIAPHFPYIKKERFLQILRILEANGEIEVIS